MRIMNAIDLGYVYDKTGKQINVYTPEGLEILANLIEGNVDSCNRRFYGMYDALARDILGFNLDYKDKNKVIPSSLQCYSTNMRDPGFYRLYKRIMTYFLRFARPPSLPIPRDRPTRSHSRFVYRTGTRNTCRTTPRTS